MTDRRDPLKIINVKEYRPEIDEAVAFIHGAWGSEASYDFYYDVISNSTSEGHGLPRFFLLVEDEDIIGCSALLINDLISRQDLCPWFSCLYIDETKRGNGLGKMLIRHGEQEAARCGFKTVYLSTDHDGYYEKSGWMRIEDGYELTGRSTRIYMKEIR